MPHKRKRKQKLYCIHCQRPLWRLESPKYHLYYQGVEEIKNRLQISHKKASFLAAGSRSCIDSNTWLEEFLCQEDGRYWLLVSRQPNGELTVAPAKSKDWNCATRVIDPDVPNPSVSEFTLRASRRAYAKS